MIPTVIFSTVVHTHSNYTYNFVLNINDDNWIIPIYSLKR